MVVTTMVEVVVVVVVVGLGSSSISTSFYRAIAWTMRSQDVCPSFRLSHVSILSKQLDILFFHHRITTPFYIFSIPNVMQYSDRESLTVRVGCRDMKKISRFSISISVYVENTR